MPENYVSKLNAFTGLGLYVAMSHSKAMSKITKPSCKIIFELILEKS